MCSCCSPARAGSTRGRGGSSALAGTAAARRTMGVDVVSTSACASSTREGLNYERPRRASKTSEPRGQVPSGSGGGTVLRLGRGGRRCCWPCWLCEVLGANGLAAGGATWGNGTFEPSLFVFGSPLLAAPWSSLPCNRIPVRRFPFCRAQRSRWDYSQWWLVGCCMTHK
jgi:hypothetical protein